VSDINGSTTINGPFTFVAGFLALPPATVLANERLDWFGSGRLRLGYAGIDRLLIYATGGFAYGGATLFSNFLVPLPTFPASARVTKFGWTVGAGAEYALTHQWMVRLEGLYIDLGRATTSGAEVPFSIPPLGFTRSKTFDLNYAVARLGVNYKFGQ